jgi:hypothetical protein
MTKNILKNFDSFAEWINSYDDDSCKLECSPELSYEEFEKIYLATDYKKLSSTDRFYRRYLRRFTVIRKIVGYVTKTKQYYPSISFVPFLNPEYLCWLNSEEPWFTMTCIIMPENDAQHIKEHLDDYRWLYDELVDEKSKRLLLSSLCATIMKDKTICLKWFAQYEGWRFEQYFDKDILDVLDDEVFVDCGASWGDTYLAYVRNYSQEYKKMYLYECSPKKHLLLEEQIASAQNVVISKAGVDASNSHAFVDGQEVKYVALDNDLPKDEKITFLKMDVEGYELAALKGAKNHIISDKPKLAICVYHKRDDKFEIAQYIKSLNPSYRLFLRYYKVTPYCDVVLYAV